QGKCDLAGFHVAESQRQSSRALLAYRHWLRPRVQKLVSLVTRQQGLMVSKNNPKKIREIRDLAAKGVRFINRQAGSGSRLEFDQLLAQANVEARDIDGYHTEEFTHLAVAATIAAGMADAGFGIKAAAVRYGLDFIPLLNERYYLLLRNET